MRTTHKAKYVGSHNVLDGDTDSYVVDARGDPSVPAGERSKGVSQRRRVLHHCRGIGRAR
jgi:hypothetical protein